MNAMAGQGYAIAPTVMVNELGDKGVKEIGNYAIEAYKAKHCPPVEWECSLVTDKNKEKTFITFSHDEVISSPIEFFNGIVEGVTKVVYNPQLDYENLHMIIVHIERNSEPQLVLIPDSIWGKKQMLQKFRDIGGRFALRKSESSILKILLDYLAIFLNCPVLTIDPRAGWVKEKDWSYRVKGSLGADELPTVFARKTLGVTLQNANGMIKPIQNLLAVENKGIGLILLSILFCAISFSRISEYSRIVQGKYIVFSCASIKVKKFCQRFLKFFIEDEMENWSLSMPCKKTEKLLMESKDQVVVVDADTKDISDRRKSNLALLEHYVKYGSLPGGQRAEAITVFLTKGIPYEISLDDALVLSITEQDVDGLLKNCRDIRLESANIVAGFVNIMLCNEKWFEEYALMASKVSGLSELLKLCAKIIMQINVIQAQIPDIEKMRQKVSNLLDAAESFADTDGISGIVCSAILKKIVDKRIKIKATKDKTDEEELSYTMLYDKQALYMTDDILKKIVLPEIASLSITPVILRKALLNEGSLYSYNSETGRKGNQRRRPIYSSKNILYRPWMTALRRDIFESYTEVSVDELQEETE